MTVRQMPQGGRPAEVARALEAVGYKSVGKTPLTTRVANELFKMFQAGEVQRRGDGRYTLKG